MPGDELFYLSVSELAKRIEAKKLSPVDLTQAYLDRSQKFGPRFNAYARLTPEIALEQAKAAEKEIHRGHYRGPLHGIPYAAKDSLAGWAIDSPPHPCRVKPRIPGTPLAGLAVPRLALEQL